MTGASIAAEVSAALAEAGVATGAGKLVATLRKRSGSDVPWTGVDLTLTDAETTVVQVRKRVVDGPAMVARYVDALLMDPTGPAPAKGDQVAVGVLPAEVTDATVWVRLGEVEIVAPGGVPVLYKASLDG